MAAYNFQLLLKHVLHYGLVWAPDQQIVYRDQVRYTYTQMYQRVLQLGAALQGLGVKPGAKVGVIEWDSHRYLEMYFGVPGIGAILHTINPRLAPEDLFYVMMHAEDDILIFHEDFLPLVEKLRPRLSSVRKYILITDNPQKPAIPWMDAEYEELLASATPLPELPDMDENTVATMSYTTGTTGKPKGVYFTHRQLTLHTFSICMSLSAHGNYGGVTKHDVYMPLTPMFHIHAWGIPYLFTMLGLKQVYPGKYEPAMILRLVLTEKVTVSHCVPTVLQMIVGAGPMLQSFDLSHWRIVIGGARLYRGLAEQATRLGIKVWAGYGMSETCPVLTFSHLKPFMETEWDEDRRLDQYIKTGISIPFVYMKVVDAAGNEVARDGEQTGEIVVRAPWCVQGYYKDPEKSAELWAGDWMHTGDVANVDEYGYIQIVDRLKDIIKSGGEWIVSMELENLLSMHPGVMEAAVIGIPDPKWEERPLAIVVPRPDYKETLTAEMLKAHMMGFVDKGVLTKWAVPDSYVLVDEIPKTSVGKIDKKVLRSRFAQA